MSDIEEIRFVARHTFTRVDRMRRGDAPMTEKIVKFNFPWKIGLYKRDYCLDTTFTCGRFPTTTDDWSIEAEFDVKVVGCGRSLAITENCEFSEKKRSINVSFASPHVFSYMSHGNLTVEWHARIKKIQGVDLKKLRKSIEKEYEKMDMVLMVAGEKFRVNKKFLSLHSRVFKQLFAESSAHSREYSRSSSQRMELKNVDPTEFRNFLKVINGKGSIDDDNVEGVIYLGWMYDARIVLKKCEKFLIENSERPVKMRFEAAIKYKMDGLQKKCLSEVQSKVGLCEMIRDVTQLDAATWKQLFVKAVQM